AVIDTERAHIAEDTLDDLLAGDALATENLYRTIHYAPDGFRAEDFGHARLEIAALALIQHPGAMPDRQAGGVQVELVVCQHETDTLVLAQRAAEGFTGTGILGGDIMSPASGAQPA